MCRVIQSYYQIYAWLLGYADVKKPPSFKTDPMKLLLSGSNLPSDRFGGINVCNLSLERNRSEQR